MRDHVLPIRNQTQLVSPRAIENGPTTGRLLCPATSTRWSESACKIFEQRLDDVNGASPSPDLQSFVLEAEEDARSPQVEVHSGPKLAGPLLCQHVGVAAFDVCGSPSGSVADDDIPAALATLKTMRQEIDVLRSRQKRDEASKPALRQPSVNSQSTCSPQNHDHKCTHEESRVMRAEACLRQFARDSQPKPSFSQRQEQQELRILALQAKMRHVEQQLSGPAPNQQPVQDSYSTVNAKLPRHLDRLIETELGTLKNELRAQHMEQDLAIVQEANIIRQDVSLALRNERETRSGEVADLRSALDAMQEHLTQEFRGSLELVGSRFEQHLLEAMKSAGPNQNLDATRVLQNAIHVHQGKTSREHATNDIDIEREARCRNIIDLRMELEGMLAQSVENFEQRFMNLAEEISSLGEKLGALMNSSGCRDGANFAERSVSFGKQDCSMAGGDIQVLAEQLDSERRTRSSEVQDLMHRVETLLSRLSAAEAGAAQNDDSVRGVTEYMRRVEVLLQEVEAERALWMSCVREVRELKATFEDTSGAGDSVRTKSMLQSMRRELEDEREARTIVIQNLHVQLGRELAEIRERDESRSKAFERSIKCERDARVSETSEIRALLDSRAPLASTPRRHVVEDSPRRFIQRTL